METKERVVRSGVVEKISNATSAYVTETRSWDVKRTTVIVGVRQDDEFKLINRRLRGEVKAPTTKLK